MRHLRKEGHIETFEELFDSLASGYIVEVDLSRLLPKHAVKGK